MRSKLEISIAPRTLALIALGVLAGLLIPRLASILTLLFLALVVAAALAPLATYLHEHWRLPRWLAPLLVFPLVFGALGILILLAAPMVALQAGQFAEALPGMVRRARASWHWIEALGQRFQIEIAASELVDFISQRAAYWLRSTATAASAVLGAMATFAGIILLAFFVLLEGPALKAGFVRLFPPAYRAQVADQFEPIAQRLGAYVRGVLVNMAALGGMLALAYSVIGLPFAIVLGILTGLLEIIPVIGGMIGGMLAILVGITVSWHLGLYTLLVFAIAQLIQNNIIGPAVMAKSVEMPPIVLLLSLLVGSELMGLSGAIIAVPAAAVLMVLLDRLWVPAIEGTVATAVPVEGTATVASTWSETSASTGTEPSSRS